METKSKKQKNRREKPWDTDDIDHWKIESFSKEDNGNSFLEISSFVIKYPEYRDTYLREVWDDVRRTLKPHGVKALLDLENGTMAVETTKKTFDPFIIIKARDLIHLLARGVPATQTFRILEDEVFCDIIKIGNQVRNKERFIKRRQRLVGPNGATLKALELLTRCYILVQGQTVACMGALKGLKLCRRVVEDCMHNIHPVYHIKELMIKRELEKKEEMKDEIWDRFLPNFKKKRQARKKKREIKKEEVKSHFPPEQIPRKEDIALETGEFFTTSYAKRQAMKMKQRKKDQETRISRFERRAHESTPPENLPFTERKKRKAEETAVGASTEAEAPQEKKKKKRRGTATA